MVNILRKEKAKRYINELYERVQYWATRDGVQAEVYRRSLARYSTAKIMYAILTGEEHSGGVIK